jgi:hypothetical protein
MWQCAPTAVCRHFSTSCHPRGGSTTDLLNMEKREAKTDDTAVLPVRHSLLKGRRQVR